MSFRIVYKPLLEVNIDHDYFLDDGDDKFISMSEEDQKNQLLGYKVSEYLEIIPTPITRMRLQNHKIIFRLSDRGFVMFIHVDQYEKASDNSEVYAPKVELGDDLTFTFELRYKDSTFTNYTNTIVDDEAQLYFFTNVIPTTEPVSFPDLFDSKQEHTNFLLTPEGTRKMTHEILNNEVAPMNDTGLELIIKMDEADIELPENATLLDSYNAAQKRNGQLGYIQITVKGDANDLLENNTVLIPDAPNKDIACLPEEILSSEIQFKNRETYWKYINVEEDKEYITNIAYPLTQKGFIALRPNRLTPRLRNTFLLNPDKDIIRTEEGKVYSEIFI
ncbi:hypothetical protein [Aquimarina pacifica]|uniref:hypothetical protein n=1 Tax=Aquimarina pacifica TaxID=1296415 RepID=UPI000471555F|nr:hypothetical protein [Aquimarina pacifica]